MNRKEIEQLQADIPEMADLMREGVRAHSEELARLGVEPKTWPQLIKLLASFVDINLRIGRVLYQSYLEERAKNANS